MKIYEGFFPPFSRTHNAKHSHPWSVFWAAFQPDFRSQHGSRWRAATTFHSVPVNVHLWQTLGVFLHDWVARGDFKPPAGFPAHPLSHSSVSLWAKQWGVNQICGDSERPERPREGRSWLNVSLKRAAVKLRAKGKVHWPASHLHLIPPHDSWMTQDKYKPALLSYCPSVHSLRPAGLWRTAPSVNSVEGRTTFARHLRCPLVWLQIFSLSSVWGESGRRDKPHEKRRERQSRVGSLASKSLVLLHRRAAKVQMGFSVQQKKEVQRIKTTFVLQKNIKWFTVRQI